jgi:hypothetical protein
VPSKYCTLFQRFGRGARHPSYSATAVLIAEPKYFDDTKKALEERAEKRRSTAQNRKRKMEDSESELFDSRKHRRQSQLPIVKMEEMDSADAALLLEPDNTTHSISQRQKKQNEIEEVMDSFINAPLRRQLESGSDACCRVPGNRFFANPRDLKGDNVGLSASGKH